MADIAHRAAEHRKFWADSFDRMLTNTMNTSSAATAEPDGAVTVESMLRDIRKAISQIERPKYNRLSVGSFKPLHRRIRAVYGAISIHGLPVTLNQNLPPYLGMLIGGTNRFGVPDIAIVDMRSRPHTGDMGTMLDDLRRAGAVPAP